MFLSICGQVAIDGRLARHKILHSLSRIKEGKEETCHQQRVGGCTIEQQARQGGDLGHDDAIVDGKCHEGETGKDNVVGCHAAPVDGDALLQSTTEEKVGFPDYGDEKYTDYFSQQNADDPEEGC